MHSRLKLALSLAVMAASNAAAHAQRQQWTDWGGGYLRGPDSASITVATSGGGPAKPAATPLPAAPTGGPMTDWGGGYLRGSDSASTTVATSGAGAPKPNP